MLSPPDKRMGSMAVAEFRKSCPWYVQCSSEVRSGAFGRVFKLYHPGTSKFYALKVSEEDTRTDHTREVAALSVFYKEDHVLQINEFLSISKWDYIVTEWMDLDLYEYQKQVKLGWKEAHDIFYQIVCGVYAIHSKGYMHRDLKSQNILIRRIADDIQVKVGDFGSAIYDSPERNNTLPVTTLWYRSPEVLAADKTYTKAIDIWALGCIYLELLNNRVHPLPGESEIGQLFLIFAKFGLPSGGEWPFKGIDRNCFPNYPAVPQRDAFKLLEHDAEKEIIARMFRYDPCERPSVHEVLKVFIAL